MAKEFASDYSFPGVSLSFGSELPGSPSASISTMATPIHPPIYPSNPIRAPLTLTPPAEAADSVEHTFNNLVNIAPENELTCWGCIAGLFCDFERTVYAGTRELDHECMSCTAQVHSCLRAFRRTVCGCGGLYG